MTGDVAVELGLPVPGPPAVPAAPPVLRVERGNPTPAQVAALAVVLAAASSSGAGRPRPVPRTLWTARSRFARPRPAVGPGGWRASALPR